MPYDNSGGTLVVISSDRHANGNGIVVTDVVMTLLLLAKVM